MIRVALIHWNATEARDRAALLHSLGYVVSARRQPPPELIRSLAKAPPAAIVIDLSRSPSQGRDLAVLLRQRTGTRCTPLVIAGGEGEAVRRVRKLLPDATFANWDRIAGALKRAVARRVARPVVPGSAFAACAGRPLVRKLGVRGGTQIALLRPLPAFLQTLGTLPDGVRIRKGYPGSADIVIWFARSPSELERRIASLAAGLGKSVMWIAWPKGGSAAAGDLTQAIVRRARLAAGLVDYKICSIDADWSALLFKRRQGKRAGRG